MILMNHLVVVEMGVLLGGVATGSILALLLVAIFFSALFLIVIRRKKLKSEILFS